MSNVQRIPRGDITLGQNLGSGGFGEVFAGTRRGDAPVAVKRLFDGLSEQSKTAFRREVDMMCQLRSDFVVSVYGLVDDPPQEPMLLVMERLHESLSSAYGSDPAPSLRQRVEWLLQAGRGISFLHAQSPPILHRDIKPSNMLLSSPDTGRRLKMGDFGLSKSLADITASITSRTSRSSVTDASRVAAAAAVVGTVHYLAPELMSMKPKYSPASDVYAFGVVCWETICMRLPYRHCVDQQDIKKDVRDGMREDFELEDAPDFHFPPALQAMIERAWAQDPKQRPSIDECVRDLEQFLTQLPRDAEGMVGPPPPLAGGPKQLPASLLVDGSLLRSSSSSSPPPPDSTTAIPLPVSPPPQQPPASLAVDVRQLSSLQPSDICVLLHAARPDFESKGYGKAAEKKKVTGDFILKANEVELSTLFGQMGVDAVDMPTLREAVASWKVHPAQAYVQLETYRRAADAERQKQAEEEERKQKAAEAERQRKIREEEERKAAAAKALDPKAAAASRIQGKPGIFAAVKSGDLSLVRDHVTADPSCVGRRDSPYQDEMTPLMWSAWRGHTHVCRLLLENAADVNARSTQ